jgi:hypothetical protein
MVRETNFKNINLLSKEHYEHEQQSLTQWTHWIYPLHCKNLTKSRTNLTKNDIFENVGMSSDSFSDTGHSPLFQCFLTLDNNSFSSKKSKISRLNQHLK